MTSDLAKFISEIGRGKNSNHELRHYIMTKVENILEARPRNLPDRLESYVSFSDLSYVIRHSNERVWHTFCLKGEFGWKKFNQRIAHHPIKIGTSCAGNTLSLYHLCILAMTLFVKVMRTSWNMFQITRQTFTRSDLILLLEQSMFENPSRMPSTGLFQIKQRLFSKTSGFIKSLVKRFHHILSHQPRPRLS